MRVTTTDGEAYDWKISSGRKGFRSPTGVYRPIRLEKSWYSRKYDGAMPHSVFFRGGCAIHGTTAVGALRPAGFAWLHPPASSQCRQALRPGEEAWLQRDPIALNGSQNDGLSRFAKASGPSKAKLAKAAPTKSQITKAKQRQHDFAVAQQHRNGWEAARGQILLRPSLPASVYGYQPYYPTYPSSGGWR